MIDFLRNFEAEIYKYTKHSHRARWQELQFKKYREFFPPGTILSIVYFAENYAFFPQKEIQSEYYHSDQVSTLVHILYRHLENNVYLFLVPYGDDVMFIVVRMDGARKIPRNRYGILESQDVFRSLKDNIVVAQE